MTKWVIQFTVVVDNLEAEDDKGIQLARDAVIHAKDIISGKVSTRERVLLDIDETVVQHNRYSGTFNNWYKRDS